MVDRSRTGIISAMQHFSTGDGPGIRTTLFLKGCSLRCLWCHNPETISAEPVLMFFAQRCAGCAACVRTCKTGVHSLANGIHNVDRSKCRLCGACAAICPAEAIQLNGSRKTVAEVMRFILEDKVFYEASGGGVTLSGGEPLLQADFCAEVAQVCRENSVPVILDTAGHVAYAAFRKVLPFIDTVYFDLKGASADDYQKTAGGDLLLILENMRRLVSDGADITACIPVIPGYNDSIAYCRRLAALLLPTGVRSVRLLPYHRLGSEKYRALDLDYPLAALPPPAKETMQELLSFFTADFNAKIDG